MRKLTSAKIFFCLAFFLFVAKPFLGFSLFSRLHPPTAESIFIKAFTKRKVEEPESNRLRQEAILKNLTDASQQFVLLFSAFLSTLLPIVFLTANSINNSFQVLLKLRLSPSIPTWLLNGKLII